MTTTVTTVTTENADGRVRRIVVFHKAFSAGGKTPPAHHSAITSS
jgi:hypothetical protein